jgi:hypothetical protein
MPDFENAAEKQQLRTIERRRVMRGVAIAIPVLTAWWQVSGWVAQHWGLHPEFVRGAALLVFGAVGIFTPGGISEGLSRDPGETLRVRWLSRERADERTACNHILLAFVLGVMLFIQCLALLGPTGAIAGFSGLDGLVSVVLTAALGLRWRPGDLGDEGAQFRSLVAVNRAFLVTLVACVGAIELDAYRAGMLRPALEGALLVGCLTLQLSLIVSERRAASGRE